MGTHLPDTQQSDPQESSNVSTLPHHGLEESDQTIPQSPVNPKKPPSLKNILLIIAVAFIVLGISGGLGYYLLAGKFNQTPQTNLAVPTATPFAFKVKAVYVSGAVYKLDNERKVEIKENDILSEGDSVITEKDGRIVLLFDEGSIIRLDSDSKLVLTQITSALTNVDDKQGTVFVRVNKDNQHTFKIAAGNLTVEAMGTAYAVENRDEVKVKVFESEVKVKTQDQEETKLATNQEWTSTDKKVTAMNLRTVQKNEFYDWSLKEEKLTETTPTPSPKPTQTPKPTVSDTYQIKASAERVPNGIRISWEVKGIDTPYGFKVIKNLTGNPVFPGDDYQYLSDPSTRTVVWEIKDGKTWHFRVCQYLGGTCGVYSNDVTVTASGGTSEEGEGSISSITLSAERNNTSSAKLTWTVVGSAPKGFKVVWSESSNPTYPTREGDWFVYLSNPESRNTAINELQSGKTYYFRVCEYTGSACGIYSNQISLAF